MGGTARVMENMRYVTKGRIVGFIAGFIVFCIFLVFVSGGFIIIKSDKNPIEGYIQPFDTSNFTDQKIEKETEPIYIDVGSWKLIYKTLGTYVVEIRQESEKNIYLEDIKPFYFKEITPNFSRQKTVENLGFSSADCLTEAKNKVSVSYFYCDSFVDSEDFLSTTTDGKNYKDMATGSITKSYNNKVFTVFDATENDELTAGVIDDNIFTKWLNSSEIIKELGEDKNPEHVIIDNNSKYIVLYNKNKNRLIVYEDFYDKHPKNIPVSKYIKNSSTVDFKLNHNTLYILNIKNKSEANGIGEIKPLGINYDQNIVKIDLASNKASESNFPKEYTSDYVSANKDILAIYGFYNRNPIVTLSKNGEKYSYKLPYVTNSQVCVSGNNFYYLSSFTGEIYWFNTKEKYSSLIYSNPSDNVVSLSCDGEKDIYFASLPKDSQQNLSDYRWFRLSDKGLEKDAQRMESIFPIIDDALTGIDWSYQFKNKVYISLAHTDGTCVVSTKEKEELFKKLTSLGITIIDYEIILDRVC